MATKFDTLLGTLRDDYWQRKPTGIQYKGHIAIGNQADVDGIGPVNSLLQDIFGGGTVSYPLSIQEIYTGTPAVYNSGLAVKAVSDASTTPTGIFGIEATAATLSTNTKGSIILAGFFGGVRHSGTGTVTSSYGMPGLVSNASSGSITTGAAVYGVVNNTGTGSMTNAVSVHADAITNSGGGSITNAYGLYLANQTVGSANFNLYSTGLASRNYFGGYVETSSGGGFYLGTTGSINNRFLLNTPLASDSTAEQINTPSSTARKGLVLQMNSGQTANAFEVQTNSGVPITYISPTGVVTFGGSRTFTGLEYMVQSTGTYTIDYASAVYPIAFGYSATVIFNQNGYGFGSGFLFWNHPTIQNNSGSTRSAGPMGGFVSQPTYQANGGAFSPGYDVGLLHGPTINVINSGTLSMTSSMGSWVQGATIGAGATLTNYIGHLVDYSASVSGTLTNSAGFVSATLAGTNKTHLLLGTSTIPGGSWGIYQSSTETNLLSGDLTFVKEVARTIQITDTTTAATAGAALTILGAAGSNTTSGAGGAINVTGGAGRQGNSSGGAITLTGGAGVGLSTGGAVNIVGGSGLTGGSVIINAGNGVADGNIRIASTDGLVGLGHANAPSAHLDIRSRVASTDALSVDNVAVSANIAIFKDNGTAVWTIADGGTLTAADGINIAVGTSTGSKIGTSTSQKIGLWNTTPIAQPTTSVASATLSSGGGTTITDTDTFDGYTIKQVVKALRNLGVLA